MTWKNEKKSKALLVVFGIYLALLVWCILFKFALHPEEIPHLRGINLIPYAASVVVNGKVQISEIIENMLVFLPFGRLHLSLLSGQRNPEPHSPCIGTEPVF